jgi:hypothetical protein
MLQHDADDEEDADVPLMAVEALNAASRQAREAGYELVVVRHGNLVRVLRDGSVEVIKQLPPRQAAPVNVRSSRS